MHHSAQGLPRAGVAKRLAAMGYDSLLIFALLFIATLAYSGLLSLLTQEAGAAAVTNDEVIHQLEPIATGPIYDLYLILVTYAFFGYFWHRAGQTLGMQSWRLRIQDLGGGNLSYRQTGLRFAGAILSAACLGLGYWWIWVDKQGRSWHDHLSGSEVVVLPKK